MINKKWRCTPLWSLCALKRRNLSSKWCPNHPHKASLDEYETDGNLEAFLMAIRTVAEAKGVMSELARRTELNRQSLYRTLSKRGNPRLRTLGSMERVSISFLCTFTSTTEKCSASNLMISRMPSSYPTEPSPCRFQPSFQTRMLKTWSEQFVRYWVRNEIHRPGSRFVSLAEPAEPQSSKEKRWPRGTARFYGTGRALFFYELFGYACDNSADHCAGQLDNAIVKEGGVNRWIFIPWCWEKVAGIG